MQATELAWKIRRHGIEMTHLSGGSHIGAVLSVADIIAVLYADILRYDSENPMWEDRDRFILSKGHAGASIYVALAESGFFPVSELKTHYANGSRLSGHVSHHVPGVDFSTGSLGHGLSVSAGMALVAQKNQKSWKSYVVLGDGECNEGSIWEAVMFAAHFRLNNLIAVVDHNRMQSLDFCNHTMNMSPLAQRWKAFGWNTVEVDGHDLQALGDALKKAGESSDRPSVIIANTIKGKGVSFMENDILWHYRFPHNGWEYDQAVRELHMNKPAGVADVYTPNGICNPAEPGSDADIGNDHTMSSTYHPNYR